MVMNNEIKEIIINNCGLQESSTIIEYITNLQESEAYYYGQYIDYKSRNEKAINILELSSQNKGICTRPETDTIRSALNILNGGDEE